MGSQSRQVIGRRVEVNVKLIWRCFTAEYDSRNRSYLSPRGHRPEVGELLRQERARDGV